MRIRFMVAAMFVMQAASVAFPARAADQQREDAALPGEVKADWESADAWRQTTPTRERLCVNGLWRWQPVEAGQANTEVPAGGWGYFKVPGCWPGVTDYLQADCQTVYPDPSWRDLKLGGVSAAWYQREIDVPASWGGRRVALSIDYLNSFASVYVDGKKVGDARFPAGEVDLTQTCPPGSKHVLSLLVIALPLKGVTVSYTDTAAAREVKGAVPRRGLCGDVYLVSRPTGPGIDDVRIHTSVRRSDLELDVAVHQLSADTQYIVRARVTESGRRLAEFSSASFKASELAEGRFAFTTKWKADRLWDRNTPGTPYEAEISLLDASGKVLDTSWPERFGFRELWIDGRDFYLNGTRIFLSAVPLDNASMGAAWANHAAAAETFERLKGIGINCVYTHNYDCEPGAHLSFEEILRAADDTGMLVALTQPHFAGYDWKAPDAEESNGYKRDAAFYVRVAGNHPSVVFYATSHNATGYDEDMNPDLIDGIHDRRDTWAANNARRALRAEAIIRRLDPTRIVYHHAGGNIGSMHTINFYPNFAPTQELNDWFGHWAESGIKPLFLCEYGAPFSWDWTMYRGWYQGKREFGSAEVPWEFCLAEWDAQFVGDRAYALGEPEKANLRWEAKQFEAGKLWHRWDYPTEVGSPRFEGRNEVIAAQLADNWRSYRTWGVSGISPWEYEMYWTSRAGVDRGRQELKVDWKHLQRPGVSADYVDRRLERMDVAFDRADWIPTAAGKALLRNNQPVLAYIAGKAGAFTSKDHNFRAGEIVEKQLIIINNSRRKIAFHCDWSLGLPRPLTGDADVSVETGQQGRIPLRFELPPELPAGSYPMRARARFDDGQDETQSDSFAIDVSSGMTGDRADSKIALFDPRGETASLMEKLGVKFRRVDENAAIAADDTLVIGRFALTVDGMAPNVGRVREGLKVIIFEQASDVLEKRLGFRTTEYGLRQVFERIPDHPLLSAIAPEQLHDWRGEATTVPPRLAYESRPQHGPTIRWCDLAVSRVWRCGNRGDVASVLIEKPACGDFRAVLDGGFDLQFAPLIEYRDGKGLILFCQMDVTGRTESDPAAERLVANLFRYAASFTPALVRRAVYAGDPAGLAHLKACGVNAAVYQGEDLSPAEQVLILGPNGGRQLASKAAAIAAFVKGGGRVLAIALTQQDADALLPFKVKLKDAEHFSAVFDPPDLRSPFSGIGPADAHSRAARPIPLVVDGITRLGDGVLAFAPGAGEESGVVFWQLAPWQLDYLRQPDLRRTYRRSSFTLTRLLANMGVSGATPLLDRIGIADHAAASEKRWLDGLYLDSPQEMDDPYRFFRW
jgi:beta-galactosidase